MRRTLGALLAIAAVLPVIPAVAAVIKPATGDYQGTVNGTGVDIHLGARFCSYRQ